VPAKGASAEWAKSNISVHIAESLLGDIYESGRGVAVDHTEAAKWFRLAADGKYADAQFKMGRSLVQTVSHL
jgi:TPR repeat protein